MSIVGEVPPVLKLLFAGYLEGEDRAEEAIAFAAMDREASASSFAKRLFQRLRNFFRAIANYFRGHGFDTPESIFGKIDEGQFGERLSAGPQALRGRRYVAGIREACGERPRPDIARLAVSASLPSGARCLVFGDHFDHPTVPDWMIPC
jgi:hypothetical protein